MKKTFSILITLLMLSGGNLFGQDKLAQTGFQFLTITSDAKAAALGGAITAVDGKSDALFFNPASMGFDTSFVSLSFSLNNWIADINHQNMSFSIRPADGAYGEFGVSLQLVDYGDILGTEIAPNDDGYIDIGIISPSAMAVGLGYSKQVADRFSIGGQVKWVRQSLGESLALLADSSLGRVDNNLSLLAFDFGTLFKTGYKSFAFGMSVRNFSAETKYVQELFQLPLKFTIGVSMDVMDFTDFDKERHSLVVSLDAMNYRSHPAQVGIGIDYEFMKTFSIRGSYITENYENSFNVGFGARLYGVAFDYAYSPYGLLGDINRFSVRFSY